MNKQQETILKIAKAGWFPDMSLNNFPKIHSDDDAARKNLEEALSAIEELGVGVFSISAQRPDVLKLITHAKKKHPTLSAGIHSLMNAPHGLERAWQQHLRVPPALSAAHDTLADIMTSLNGFSKDEYDIYSGNSSTRPVTIIAGGITPTEWQAEWDKGANFVKFAGAELFPPNYMATYMPSLHNLIPFYVSGYIVKPEWRLDKEKIKSALAPYIKNAAGEFVGTFTFGFGYPFSTNSREDILKKGRLLLSTIAEIRKETRTPSGMTLYDAIETAGSYESLVRNTGRSFNA